MVIWIVNPQWSQISYGSYFLFLEFQELNKLFWSSSFIFFHDNFYDFFVFLNKGEDGFTKIFRNVFSFVLLEVVKFSLSFSLIDLLFLIYFLTISSVLSSDLVKLLHHWVIVIFLPNMVNLVGFLSLEGKIIYELVLMWIWASSKRSWHSFTSNFLRGFIWNLERRAELSENIVDIKGLIHAQ